MSPSLAARPASVFLSSVNNSKEFKLEEETKAGWIDPWNNSFKFESSNPARPQAMDIKRFLAT